MINTTSFPTKPYQLTPVETIIINTVKKHDASPVPITCDRLQQLTGCSPEQIQEATHSLKDKGLLQELFIPRRLI